MIILGIADGADASAALMVNNTLVAAVTEDAVRRVRHAHGFPSAAIDAVLDIAGLRPKDVDRVIFAGSFTPAALFRAQPGLRKDPVPGPMARWMQSALRKSGLYMVDQGFAVDILQKRLRGLGFSHAFVDTQEHDRAHAAAAYRTQPRDEVLVFTMDSPGDGASLSVSEARHLQIDRTFMQSALSALATFSSRVARVLGVQEEELEWLATEDAPADLVAVLAAELNYVGPYFNRRPTQRGPDPLLRYKDRGVELASAALKVLEEAVAACVVDHVGRAKMRHVAAAGSVLQIARVAGRLAELSELESLWIPPLAGDVGLSIGAILAAAGTPVQRLQDPCLGMEHGDQACYRALSNASLPRDSVAGANERMAEDLVAGKTVARFTGRLEFSWRGLGNRDVLASTEAGASLRMGKVLRREGAARVGVVLLKEDAMAAFPDLMRVSDAARFQAVALRPSAAFAAAHPGVLRPDGRMLPQVVHQEDDPSLYELLCAYKAQSGRVALASAPLCRPNEPVAASPADAIGVWRDALIDVLYLENYRVEK